MRRFCCALAVLGAVLSASTAGLKAGSASSAEPVTTGPSQHRDIAVVLNSGGVVQCKLLLETVPVETEYGRLGVPAGDVYLIIHGARQEPARPEDATGPEQPQGAAKPPLDTVVTRAFTLVGRVALEGYPIETSFKKLSLSPERVRTISFRAMNVGTAAPPAILSTKEAGEARYWRTSDREEAGWRLPTFDDSRWVLATGAAAKGNWATSGMRHPAHRSGKDFFFRRCFVLEDMPVNATLEVGGAESHATFVNGSALDAYDGPQDITSRLRKGMNVIAVKARLPQAGLLSVKVALRSADVPTLWLPTTIATNVAEEIRLWRVSDRGTAGWTRVDFDDGRWAAPVAVYSGDDQQVAGMKPADHQSATEYVLRRRFLLETQPASATLVVTEANEFTVYVNGIAVTEAKELQDVKALLKVGVNVIAVKARFEAMLLVHMQIK